MSFARRYAEQGDYEVSGEALGAIVLINIAYIQAKGRTFYETNPFFENPLASDGFINDTLECLRQNVQRGISRQDEQQIEQSLKCMAALVKVYLGIDYSTQNDSKSHAKLAAVYLAEAVQRVGPHDMGDVLLEGQRLMGRCAQRFVADGNLIDISMLTEKIALVASFGCAKEQYRAVTREGMAQFANLTLDLIRSKHGDIRIAADEILRSATFVAKLFLSVPVGHISTDHSTFLAPFYSSTSTTGLRSRLIALGNALSDAEPDDADAQACLWNIELWADGLHRTQKELLLAAIEARSHFTFDMFLWITGVTEILLAASNAPACDDRTQRDLRKHASWLIGTLNWIPDDSETITLVECGRLTERFFEAAMNAHRRGCEEIAMQIHNDLLSWAFKGGKSQTGWAVLEYGLCGCAVLSLMEANGTADELKAEIRSRSIGERGPEWQVLDDTATRIRDRVDKLPRGGHWSSSIEHALSQAEYNQISVLLIEIAEILSSAAADIAARGDH